MNLCDNKGTVSDPRRRSGTTKRGWHRHRFIEGTDRGSRIRVCRDCRAVQRMRSGRWVAGAEAANPTEQKNIARRVLDSWPLDKSRRQERVDSLTGHTTPVWADEGGAVSVRLLCGAAGAAALVLLVVWLVWPYLVGAGVMVAAWRVVTRHTRRRRPRSSWSSMGRTAALMFAAWNSRWLKGATFKASVPASVGREHAPCGECGHDTVPF